MLVAGYEKKPFLGYLFLNEADDHIQLDLFDARIIFPE
jgi:hypothetical protein|tara:strand:+ start:1685 stop:1798 length:114 start_codon:yes stop_codon:yes gene_type:complete